MSLTIPDDMLREAGLTEEQAQVEFACRLFDLGKLSLWSAAKWAGLTRVEFESQLRLRRIAVYRPSQEDLAEDLATLNRLGA
jgi:predicted HTH domain antitoxin